MGGFGSGGWNQRHRSVVEHHRRLDAGKMNRLGVCKDGYIGGWVWTSTDGERNWIGVRCETGELKLDYKYRLNGGEWQPVRQSVPLAFQDCNKGGKTALFLCPHCGKRRKYLYGAGRLFLCRECHDLTYMTRRERVHDRAGRRARMLRRKLGVELGRGEWIGPKPKGMHQATFDRMRDEIHACEEVLEEQLVVLLGRMQARQTHVRQQSRRFWS